MPARMGPRFAIEALFLIALAVGVAYADLATKWIFVVMAGGWLVVALLELTADRIWAAAPPSFTKTWFECGWSAICRLSWSRISSAAS